MPELATVYGPSPFMPMDALTRYKEDMAEREAAVRTLIQSGSRDLCEVLGLSTKQYDRIAAKRVVTS